ncbi:hypothetical protein HI914_04675 [Erysiphe necator]|nr:hypothetical protein HI914_04675 [Erysiphe necator]
MALSALPEPALSFLIPSQHDALNIQCRVYHPDLFLSESLTQPSYLNQRAVIIAHPYAVLGGSMDDRIVSQIALICLREGYIVGTFNFRGAGESEGSTSWQSKPEQNDYMSVIGFMTYYLHYLSLPQLQQINQLQSDVDHVPIHNICDPQKFELNDSLDKDQLNTWKTSRTRLLLAGYSYGALITMSLPATIQSILEPFEEPLVNSTHGRIRQKARDLAKQQISSTKGPMYLSNQDQPQKSMSIVAQGPGECPYDSWLDSRLSYSSPKNSMNSGSFTFQQNYRSENSSDYSPFYESNKLNETLPQIKIAGSIDVAYLLVSPIQGIICDLLTFWSFKPWRQRNSLTDRDIKLKLSPTLAIYGEGDFYVSAKSIQDWAEKLAVPDIGQETNQFKYVEISGAGHFWNNESATRLWAEIRIFVQKLK